MTTKKQELVPLTEEQLAVLNESFPVGDEQPRLLLPRFGMLAKDITEETGTGKNKKTTVLQSAGTFYTETDKGEVDEKGKKVWTKDFMDEQTVDVNIVYFRYQLKYYDQGLKKFISTPVYDNAEQVLPLYLEKKVIKRGTEKELQAMYPKLTQKGKPSSDLKKLTILYVMYNGELHQFNLSTSSGWEFSSYKQKVNPSTVVTTLSSTEETFGINTFSKTMFNVARPISADEFNTVSENQAKVKETAEADSKFLLGAGTDEEEAEEEFKKF